MRNLKLTVSIVGIALFLALAGGADPAGAFSRGPFLERTGAPGETTCAACHVTYALNSGAGGVAILGLPERYEPGRLYPVTVRVEDPAARLWGFEITAVDDAGAAAGFFQKTDPADRTIEALGPGERYGRYYARQTIYGTYDGVRGAVEWRMLWKAPPEDRGPVTLYAAGNAANGDHSDLYDYIYATSVTVEGQRRNVRVRLVEPGGGALGAGEPAVLRWEATDGDEARPASFRVELSTDGGTSFPTVLADGLAPEARAFVWHVPEALRADRARLRVVVVDTAGGERADASRVDLRVAPLGLERVADAFAPLGGAPRAAAWADVDGDGSAEAAVARPDGRVALVARGPDGRYAERTTAGLEGARAARLVAWGDLDGDGRPDLAVASEDGLSVYRYEGEGVFADVGVPTSASGVAPVRALAWGDLDGDGFGDLVVAGEGGVAALRGAADGLEDATGAWGLGAVEGARAAAIAGGALAVGGADGVRVYAFEEGRLLDRGLVSAAAVASLEWADLTGDGLLDLAGAGPGGALALEARGDGQFVYGDATARLGLAGLGPLEAVRAGDFDGDARPDLFAAGAGAARLLRAAEGGFEDVTDRVALGVARDGSWVAADANATLDLAVVGADGLALFANPRAAGAGTSVRARLAGGRAAIGAVVRVDLDGDLDWSTGVRAARVLPAWGGDAPFVVPAAAAGVRVEYTDGTAVERVVPAGTAVFEAIEAPEISAARAKGTVKLVVDGARLPRADARVEVDGRPLAAVKAPARFADADGTSRRLVARDPRLGEALGRRPVTVRVVDPATGAVSAPFVLE